MVKRELTFALVISLMMHVLVLVFFQYVPANRISDEDSSAVEVFLSSPDGGWQIADIPPSENDQKPDKSKFLGMYNQSVGEETVAHPKPETRNPKPDKNLYGFDKNLFTMKSPLEKDLGAVSSGAPQGSQATIPEDFYPDFKYGEHTYLNVLRYPEVEYFVRLKRIFKTTWDPVSALRQDMQATSVNRGMVSVILAVSVDKVGGLSELFILRSSSLANYDKEALRTIRASSPYASPPEKFLDKDGFLRMSWTFVVYL